VIGAYTARIENFKG